MIPALACLSRRIRRAFFQRKLAFPVYGLSSLMTLASFIAAHPAAAHMSAAHTGGTGRTMFDVVRSYRAAVTVAARRSADASLPRVAVRAGQSISGISQAACATAADWTGIYAASRRAHLTARNANNLNVGQQLAIECDQVPSMAGRAYTPPPPPPPPVAAAAVQRQSAPVTSDTGTGGTRSPAPVAAAAVGGSSAAAAGPSHVGTAGMGSYQACVIARESGGQTQVMNASGHYGLYQFDAGTWASGGGNPADFGHASAAEQGRVFAAVYAARGTQPWSPSDGC